MRSSTHSLFFGVVLAFLRAWFIFRSVNHIPPRTVYLLELQSRSSAHILPFGVVFAFLRAYFTFWSRNRAPPCIVYLLES